MRTVAGSKGFRPIPLFSSRLERSVKAFGVLGRNGWTELVRTKLNFDCGNFARILVRISIFVFDLESVGAGRVFL